MYVHEAAHYLVKNENGKIQRKAGINPTAGTDFEETELEIVLAALRGRHLRDFYIRENGISVKIKDSRFRQLAASLGYSL